VFRSYAAFIAGFKEFLEAFVSKLIITSGATVIRNVADVNRRPAVSFSLSDCPSLKRTIFTTDTDLILAKDSSMGELAREEMG